MIIGITGGTGCGKTTALEAAKALGGLVLDCDAIYHQLLQTDKDLLAAIEHRFPGVVLEGKLLRKKLGEIVFESSAALKDLNAITHNAVKQAVLKALSENPGFAVIDAIALFESGLSQVCDVTVAVTAPEEARISRLVSREEISREYAQARINAQRPQGEFEALCDCALVNDGTREEFYEKCLGFFKKWAIIEQNT